MQHDLFQITQLTIDATHIPIVFRGIFVLFLALVMVWVKEDGHKKIKTDP